MCDFARHINELAQVAGVVATLDEAMASMKGMKVWTKTVEENKDE